jgi:hypothetical protein
MAGLGKPSTKWMVEVQGSVASAFKSRFAVMADDPSHAAAIVSERLRIDRQFVRLVKTLGDREIGDLELRPEQVRRI